jgi:hypothetical protein
MPWNTFGSKKNFFVELSERHIERKIQCLSEYKSQGDRMYSSPKIQKAISMVSGIEIGKEFAEGLELIRAIHQI